ncbi:hypothetical protein C0995_012727 [Termitomyces sp. Mi166|nr:hypothetical protein C0995_012727 [Termitomyces sp. Mi166\
MFSAALVVSFLPAVIVAQYGGPPPAPTTSAAVAVPSAPPDSPGQMNSSFEEPCTYLAASGNSSAGFDSGLQSAKTFTILIVDDTKPIWFHCKQVSHCGMGMVGSINAPATGNNFDTFHQAALNIGSSEVTETDNGPMTGGVNGIATAPPVSSTGGSSSGAISTPYNIPLASFVGSIALVLLMA